MANPFGIEKEDSLSLYDSLACIHQDTSSTSHLHFMRSGREFSTAYGPAGHLNPLSVLDPSATGSDYEWQFDPQPQSPQHPWCYFLTDNTIESWEDDWIVSTDIYADTLSTDNLHGSVDLIQGFSLWGYGDCGIQPGIGESWLVPYRIRWDLVLKGENPASDQVLVEKYLVSFDGIVGDYDDWEKYRQFFFRFPDLQTYFPGYSGDIICLTNCGDATGWTGLGISNIEEGCWNTALALDGTGENYNPILQDSSASDGFYRIDVTAYAWDTTDSQRVSIDCRVCNTREIAQSVVLTDAASRSEVWRAEWEAVETANGFEPVKNVLVDAPADPGSTLEIEIVFTGPMDTSVEPFVRFAKAGGTYLVADPATVEWTSTYLPSGYYDTWHGTVDVPSSGMSGWLTMQIKAKDNTGLGLLDPSDADPDPPVMDRYEDYTDTHHGFGIAFGPETVWDGELNHQVESSPVLADMDGDGDLDVGILDRDGWVHLLDDDGTSMNTNWPSSGSWEPWFPYPVRCSPAIADLDEDGDLDIVYQGSWTGQACDVATGDDIDGWLVECGTSGSPGYFCSYSSPSVGDTDGDDHLEVVIGRVISDTTDLKSSVFLFEDTGGTATWSRTLTPTSTGVSICATPVIGDVDGDDDVDVLVATADDYFQDIYSPGMPAATNQSAVYLLNSSTGATIWQQTFPYCQILGSPVVADLEGDETNEVIFGTANAPTSYRKIHILSGETGSIEHSLSVPGWVMGPVGIGDLDEDGYLDIVAGVNGTPGQIYAWSGAGSHALLPGFPASVIGNPCGGISIVDMDADFELEIVAGTSSGWLYAVNPDGSVCTGFPVDTGSSTMGQVAAGDIDGDGSLELVGADATLAQAWCYDMGSGSYP
ncbi:MAG: VCBS repeat-containing protein, partial [Candidatus Fermentibacter sp.]|nr:VCBS repeat-containing protein [Candidatus Fermentibacter sp.]